MYVWIVVVQGPYATQAGSAQFRAELLARRQRKAVLLAGADKFNKSGAKEGLAYLHQAGVVPSLTDPDIVAKYVFSD